MLLKFLQQIRQQVGQHPLRFLGGVAVGSALVWVYWPTFRILLSVWSHDAKYSHGYLVPAFSVALLWLRREHAPGVASFRPSAWGVLLLLAGLAVRAVGTYLYIPWFAEVSIVPCLAGFCVLVGGWPALRWTWPAVAFLLFMLPLPYRLEVALAQPLQRVATRASTYALQTCGFAAHAEGNVIVFGKVKPIGVAEACNGLSMLVIFVAISVAVTLVVQRRWLDKALIVLSAVPIALVCNITRITVTGILHAKVSEDLADRVFHDWAGWLMMPLALVLLWVEIRLLSLVLVERRPAAPLALHFGPGTAQADGGARLEPSGVPR